MDTQNIFILYIYIYLNSGFPSHVGVFTTWMGSNAEKEFSPREINAVSKK